MTASLGSSAGARGAVLGALVLTLALLTGRAAPGQTKAPSDFTMPKAETSPGDVTFSHTAHFARVSKCTTCHMRDFKMKRGTSGPVTLAAKQDGRFCGACHDGKTVMGGAAVFPIDECDRCHK